MAYIEALEWIFVVKRIHPYVKNSARHQTVGMAKLHMVDTGLACHLLGISKTQQLLVSSFYGGLLKSFVVMECFQHMAWAEESMKIYHFRDKRKNEVDIVLKQDDGYLTGIEVKASSTIREADFSGLRKFAEFTGGKFKNGIILYSGSRVLPFAGEGKPFFAVPISMLWL